MYSVVVLDLVAELPEPDYCLHGKAQCVGCAEWVWLGHATYEAVLRGDVLPMCLPCIRRHIPVGVIPNGHLDDSNITHPEV